MKKELDEKLVKKYPKIFADRYGDMRTTAMVWGFDCGDGWYFIIDSLCDSIQNYIDCNSKKKRIKNKIARYFVISIKQLRDLIGRSNIKFIRELAWNKKIFNLIYNLDDYFKHEEYESIPQVVATQVKEKFGGLCFYYNGGNRMIDGMVWLAESQSYHTCEECGTTINIGRTKGWIITLCEKCAKIDINSHREWIKNEI